MSYYTFRCNFELFLLRGGNLILSCRTITQRLKHAGELKKGENPIPTSIYKPKWVFFHLLKQILGRIFFWKIAFLTACLFQMKWKIFDIQVDLKDKKQISTTKKKKTRSKYDQRESHFFKKVNFSVKKVNFKGSERDCPRIFR